MFAYINGFLEDVTVDNAVIDVNGFGINVRISADTASRLPGIGEQVRLYTYTYVKEDAFLLYGFLSRSDLEMFKLCITVSGIGPKGALAICYGCGFSAFCHYVRGCQGDIEGTGCRHQNSAAADPGIKGQDSH